jgi:surface polysaccharide O-acyltransferase-like enzyme
MKDFSPSSQAKQSMPHLIQFHLGIVNPGTDAQQVEATQQSSGARAGTRGKPAPPAAKSSRLFFIDHLRAFLIILVIMLHLAFTYGSSINLWYYHDTTDALTTGLVTSLLGIGQAFCMGLFFLISAYFTPGAYDRKGGGQFLRDRLLRLGLPLLIYGSLINPFVLYIAAGFPGSYWQFYTSYLLSLRGIGQGPAWFIEALLFFVVFYALWRVCSAWWSHALPRMTAPTRSINSARRHLYPTTGAMILYIVGLALITFVIRIWLPMGWWFQPLNLMFAEFPQYISLFILGLIAYRRGWLSRIPDAVGKRWFWVALIDLVIFVLLSLLIGIRGGSIDYFLGGLHWQALAYASWEAIMCVAMCTSLLVFFRKHVNRPGRVWNFLSANAYAAYIFQSVILVGLAYSLHTIALHPLLKFGIVVIIAVPLCFLISSVIRKIPFANRVL